MQLEPRQGEFQSSVCSENGSYYQNPVNEERVGAVVIKKKSKPVGKGEGWKQQKRNKASLEINMWNSKHLQYNKPRRAHKAAPAKRSSVLPTRKPEPASRLAAAAPQPRFLPPHRGARSLPSAMFNAGSVSTLTPSVWRRRI